MQRLFFVVGCGLFFLGLSPFLAIGQAEERSDRNATARDFVLLLELGLALDGIACERNGLEAGMRNLICSSVVNSAR